MKGQAMEMIEIVILVAVVSILITLSYFTITSSFSAYKKLIARQALYTRLLNTVMVLYNVKPDGIERTLAQVLADRLVAGESVISYGRNTVNVDEHITRFLSYYFTHNWSLKSEEYNFSLGYENQDRTKICSIVPLPLPSLYQDVTKLSLCVW